MQLLEDFGRDYQRYRHSAREKSFLGLNGLQHVLSSNVSAVGTKEDKLIIRFHNGSVYEYPNQAERYEDILNSNSKGKWVWKHLRRKRVPYKKIGKIPLPDDIDVTDEDIFQEIDNRYARDLTKHVNVPVFQSFEFINGMSMQKILVGDIATYIPVTKPIPIVKTLDEVREEVKQKLEKNIREIYVFSKVDKDMVEASGTQLEKLFKRYDIKIKTISFGNPNLKKGLLGQNTLTLDNQVFGLDLPLVNNPYVRQNIMLRSENIEEYTDLSNKGWLTKVDDKNIIIATATHEFAHNIWNSSYQKWRIEHNKRYELKEDKEIQLGKDIIKLYKQYKKEVLVDPSKIISNYSLSNVDEFLAECFTQASLNSNPSPYAIEIKKLIDTYLGVDNDN